MECGNNNKLRQCRLERAGSREDTRHEDGPAVRIANDTIDGLAAGVWTRDIGRAVRLPKRLRAGTVWVNTCRAVRDMMPFDGMTFSGLGRESGLGAVREDLETKSAWISPASEAPANPFIIR